MPTLAITRAGLDPAIAGATCNYLISLMIWPAESDERTEFQRTCTVGRIAALGAAVPAMLGGANPEDLFDAMPIRVLWGWMKPRIYRGAAVGEFYASAVARRELGQSVSVQQLRANMTTNIRRQLHPGADISDTTLENVLREFRPSAHLWAAFYMQLREGIDVTFPCSPTRIPHFLALAEWIRAKAITYQLDQGRRLLLEPDVDVWRPPAWLRLPETRLIWDSKKVG